MYQLNETLARKVLCVVDAGLTSGLGTPTPGKMCVEAAVCYAMGLPHSDKPTCVGADVREFKIRLNDASWSSSAARTKGMRKLAIAQLGSDGIDQKEFARLVVEGTIRKILPIALRAAAKMAPKFSADYEIAALECESTGSRESANKANRMAAEARNHAYAAAHDYAAAAAYATAAAAYATAYAAYATTYAATAAAYATDYAAYATDYAAYATDYAAYATDKNRALDAVLEMAAEIGLDALKKLNSPGCKYLYLAD